VIGKIKNEAHLMLFLCENTFKKNIHKFVAFSLICFGFWGCVYQAGGGKIYEVISSTDKSKIFIELLNIKYLHDNVYGIFWTDFYRSHDGIFVSFGETERYNTMTNELIPKAFKDQHLLPDPTGITGTRIRFITLNQEYCKRLGLKPKYTWWQHYGSSVLTAIIIFVSWMLYIESGLKTHRIINWWGAVIVLLLFMLLVVPLAYLSIN